MATRNSGDVVGGDAETAGGASPSVAASKRPARDRIFETARELFYQHGIRAVGVETIASEADATKMTLYRNFPSKDELVAEVLRVAVKIGSAIETAHRAGVLHRDIKPENILMNDELEPKLCDFGWSIELNKNESRQTFCGTYEYMAPEIFETENYNSTVDVWSLGVLLYELLTDKKPFTGRTLTEITGSVLDHKPPRADEVRGAAARPRSPCCSFGHSPAGR